MVQMTVMMINWVKFAKFEFSSIIFSVPCSFYMMYSKKIFQKTSQEDSYQYYYKLFFFVRVCSWVNAFSVPLFLSVYIVVSCVWCGDVHRYVWEKGEGNPWKRRRREKEERELYFLSNYLPRIVNVNYEGARTVTHYVTNRELTEVHSKGLAPSFVSVGITFRSTPCVSAPTF